MNKLQLLGSLGVLLSTVPLKSMEQEGTTVQKNEQKSPLRKLEDLYEEIKGLARAADVATALARCRASISESNLQESTKLLRTGTCAKFYKHVAASLEAKKILFRIALLCEQKSNNAPDVQERRLFLYEAVRIFLLLADEGYVDAQTALGNILLTNNNYSSLEELKRNLILAECWLRKAADQGNVVAQNNLGGLCEKKAIISRDLDTKTELLEEAKAWYLKAAEKGLVNAQINMGAFYFKQAKALHGADRSQVLLKAEEWFRKAANQGDAQGQNKLALFYQFMYEISTDSTQKEKFYAEAINWFNKSAHQNLPEAMSNKAFLCQSVRRSSC